MPELTKQRARRPSTKRTLVVLLLVFVFCLSAMAAGGVFDEKVDPSEASTQIITGDEAARIAQDELTPDQSEESAPVALIAALLLVAGALLISLAVPTPAEKRRAAAAGDPNAPKAAGRTAEPKPAPAFVPAAFDPFREPVSSTDETMYLQPLAPYAPPLPAHAVYAPGPAPPPVAVLVPVPVPAPDLRPSPPVTGLRRVGARGRTPVGPASPGHRPHESGPTRRTNAFAPSMSATLTSFPQVNAGIEATPSHGRAQEGTIRMAERFGGHQVPKDAKEQTSATLRATVGILGMPSDAERSRTLMAIGSGGSLATMSTECPGFPFGSLVAYSTDSQGRPIMCLSSLAEHSRNMAADPRASLMITAPEDGVNDRLALSRVTLVGEMKVLEGEEREAAIELFLEGHPTAFYVRFDDFSTYRLEVEAIRYVGGFGRMSWVTAEEYANAEPDPLLGGGAARVIEHMNDDHGDALIAYCQVFSRLDNVESARMVGVDRYGMDIMATMADGAQRAARVSFTAPVNTVDEVRAATIELLTEARAQLSAS